MTINPEITHAFRVAVEFEDDGHPPLTLGVTKNSKIKTMDDAIAHCKAEITHWDKLANVHYKVSKATPVDDGAILIADHPPIQSVETNSIKQG